MQTLEVDFYCKMLMPFKPNIKMRASSPALCPIAEPPGGTKTSFDTKKFYPIVKDMSIRFRPPRPPTSPWK